MIREGITMPRMKRQMIQLTDRQIAYLAKEAARLNISLSDAIRRIIDERIDGGQQKDT